jgi:hypothetical protein
VALNTANGAEVASWPDEIGTADLAQATAGKKPTYSTTGGANSQPAIVHDSNDFMGVAVSSISSPWSVVMIAKTSAASGTQRTMLTNTNGANLVGMYMRSTGKFSVYNGSFNDGPTIDSDYHCFLLAGKTTTTFDWVVDSTSASFVTGSNQPLIYLSVSATSTGIEPSALTIAFVGVISGDVRTDPKWAAFKAWVTSHYGITVA